ncbi:arabinogalactan endo-1,4-beta-galactosidase [Duganella sp. Leaf126]|uniref:glycoside hydrolase family 53 protein n=1 Tax=Duganella sp. Leaf126 TaxID=1736266 RepID=UPI0006F5CB0B|nr:glycosyl hydrolase 53 family protein [Duganella sp. Leaf126]KQQ40116.1 arabinogalactan endo-1,4-beta-galactosidase [Duganella sp. Leaf126]
MKHLLHAVLVSALLAGGAHFAGAAAPGVATPGAFAKGADISWITEMEDAGRVMRNREGRQQSLLATLKKQGMDAVRLRVWVDPAAGYNNLRDTLVKARRVKEAGMRLMIDFHYSDDWADPAKQFKPLAWQHYSVDQLAAAVADHTRTTLTALREAGITPEWVQVGNETTNGMLWPEGDANTHMQHYARFVTAGYDAVKQVFPQALVIVHVDNCHDGARFRWNYDGLVAHGGKFDLIGASAYPTTASNLSWRAATAACLATMNDVTARYHKPVLLAEVGAPWNHPEGKAIIADLLAKVRAVNNGMGVGAFYWEPQAYDWKGYPMGAFDQQGRPTPMLDAFREQ